MASINDIKNLIRGMKAQTVPVNEGNTAVKHEEVAPQVVEEAKPQLQLVKPNNQTAVVRPQIASEAPKEATPIETTYADIKAATKALIEGTDYGYIPRVDKPILFKHGALKILRMMEWSKHETLVEKHIDVEHEFLAYTVKVTVVDADGTPIAEAYGSANTKEAKFASKGMSADSMLVGMAAKRALITAVKELM